MREFDISRPKEGLDTLVAQFAGLKIDEYVHKAQEAVGPDASPEAIRSHLAEHHADLSPRLVEKVVFLARGMTPPDDFSEQEVGTLEKPDDRTLEVEFTSGEHDYTPGDVLFFEGTRWVVGSRSEASYVLKRF